MKVMVCGGSGRREFDELKASKALDTLTKRKPITGLVAGQQLGANDAAYAWWIRRFFAPPFVNSKPDIFVILPHFVMGVTRIVYASETCR